MYFCFMFEFHNDKQRYFDMQRQVTDSYIIPFLQSVTDMSQPLKVLEIGCGEAGVLKAFADLGHECTGIELHSDRIEMAKTFMAEEVASGRVQFIVRDIYDIQPEQDLSHLFDLVILKDVIEHIPEQKKFISIIHRFLTPEGKIFFAFPPWQMPYGGHQQVCRSKVLSKLPYFHLLPSSLYRGVLQIFGEAVPVVKELMELKDTGLSIEHFEAIIKNSPFTILKKEFFLFNPIYQYKFGINTRRQAGWLAHLPWVRNFFTTAVYYLAGRN